MREILFRGKRVDIGEWIEGFLLKLDDDVYIVPIYNDTNLSTPVFLFLCGAIFKINPNTVGQYTGLTDKNGKKIFEGDIIHLYAGEHSISRYKGIDYNALVIFKDGGFCAIDGTADDYSLRRYSFVSKNLYCERIGNILDNPELLKEAEQE